MFFAWEIYGLATFFVSLLLAIVIYGAVLFILIKVVKRSLAFIVYGISVALVLTAYILNLTLVLEITIPISIFVIIIVFYANLGDLRNYIANPFKKTSGKQTAQSHLYNREKMIDIISETVLTLSKNKTGALITLERTVALDDFYKSGVIIDCGVSVELLLTIFYPGTRLHDGAVIISKDKIAAASVFYNPSTKAFTRKYGARHRAALGISEVSDSVTVVVSEETGKISIAKDGNIEIIPKEKFKDIFREVLTE